MYRIKGFVAYNFGTPVLPDNLEHLHFAELNYAREELSNVMECLHNADDVLSENKLLLVPHPNCKGFDAFWDDELVFIIRIVEVPVNMKAIPAMLREDPQAIASWLTGESILLEQIKSIDLNDLSGLAELAS